RELLIGPDGAEHHRLLAVVTPARFDYENPHDRVLVEEPPGILAVRADSAYRRRTVNDYLWHEIVKELLSLRFVREIAILAPRNRDLPAAERVQPLHDVRAEKPRAARHEHAFGSKRLHHPPAPIGFRTAAVPPFNCRSNAAISASTIISTSPRNPVLACHPST